MEYIEKMKEIQNYILEYLDDENDKEQKLDDLIKLLNFKQLQPDINEFKSFLYLISYIFKNRHRNAFFFDKIKKLIIPFKKEIKQTFSNSDIFHIFKKSKRILLLLIEEDILTFDSNILTKIEKFKDYFIPEINKLNQDNNFIEIPEFYEEKRQKGENDSYLCEIIRNDNIDEFIIRYSKNEFSLLMTINHSIYETNSFLENKNPSLIEYSAFYGSIQIFNFLFQNKVELTSSLWIYAIHGRNPEIIHFLEENQIKPKNESYQECLNESIKCHHNDFALYFKDNFLNDEIGIDSNSSAFHYYNFQFISIENKNQFCFFDSVEYDNYKLVEYFTTIKGFNFNVHLVLIYVCFKFHFKLIFCSNRI